MKDIKGAIYEDGNTLSDNDGLLNGWYNFKNAMYLRPDLCCVFLSRGIALVGFTIPKLKP